MADSVSKGIPLMPPSFPTEISQHGFFSLNELREMCGVDKVAQLHETIIPLNCPNCGAVVRTRECEYCGTVFHSDRR